MKYALLTEKPEHPAGGLAKEIVVSTADNERVGRITVIIDHEKSFQVIENNWQVPKHERAKNEIEVNACKSIAISDDFYISIKRVTRGSFNIAFVHYSGGSLGVLQQFEGCFYFKVELWRTRGNEQTEWNIAYEMPERNGVKGTQQITLDYRGQIMSTAMHAQVS